jgi:hypothetical protein
VGNGVVPCNWSSGDKPVSRQLVASIVAPDVTKKQTELFSELQRRTTSPDAARYFETIVTSTAAISSRKSTLPIVCCDVVRCDIDRP